MVTLKHKNDESIHFVMIVRFFNGITLLPLLTISTLLIFYLLTALEVGHLPTYGNPDPKFTTFAPLGNLVLIGLVVSVATAAFWAVIATYLGKHYPHQRLWFSFALYILPIVAFFIVNNFTPIMVWLLD